MQSLRVRAEFKIVSEVKLLEAKLHDGIQYKELLITKVYILCSESCGLSVFTWIANCFDKSCVLIHT